MTVEPTPRNKSEKRQRTETLYARVTPEEKAAVIDRADKAGMAVAAFMRAVALGNAGPRAQRRPPRRKTEIPQYGQQQNAHDEVDQQLPDPGPGIAGTRGQLIAGDNRPRHHRLR